MSTASPGVILATFKHNGRVFLLTRILDEHLESLFSVYCLSSGVLTYENIEGFERQSRGHAKEVGPLIAHQLPPDDVVAAVRFAIVELVDRADTDFYQRYLLHGLFFASIRKKRPRQPQDALDYIVLTHDRTTHVNRVTSAIIRWTILELFGVDPDNHVSISFDLEIPFVVQKEAVERFEAQPKLKRVESLVSKWMSRDKSKALLGRFDQIVSSVIGGESSDEHQEEIEMLEALEDQIGDIGSDIVLNLERLHPCIKPVDDPDSFPIRDARDFTWQVDIVGLEPTGVGRQNVAIYVSLELPNVNDVSGTQWILEDDNQEGITTAHARVTDTLKAASLIIEEQDWNRWYNENVDIFDEKPTLDLDIDIRPYLMLDALVPYLWPDDRFKAYLDELGAS